MQNSKKIAYSRLLLSLCCGIRPNEKILVVASGKVQRKMTNSEEIFAKQCRKRTKLHQTSHTLSIAVF